MVCDVIEIDVIYALADQYAIYHLKLAHPVRVADALHGCEGLLERLGQPLEELNVGIWGKRCSLEQILQGGERIEIYRPLIADPKLLRAKRAEKSKQEGRIDPVTGGRLNPLRRREKRG